MANGTGATLGLGISDGAVAVGGTVLLAFLAAHTITKLSQEQHKKDYWRHRPQHWRGIMSHRHVMDEIFHECLARCSHPHTVHKNRDRIYHAMHQRAPHIKELIMKGHKGQYGPSKMAEGVQNLASDILVQFDIPQHPHPSAANPRLVKLFENQRHNDINYRYSIPGGLVLDPYERQYLDKELISYAGEKGGARGGHSGIGGGHGEVEGFKAREAGRHQFEAGRLRHYFRERGERERFRLDVALGGLIPPWLLGNIWPVGPYYEPYPYPRPYYPGGYLPNSLYPGGGIGYPYSPYPYPYLPEIGIDRIIGFPGIGFPHHGFPESHRHR